MLKRKGLNAETQRAMLKRKGLKCIRPVLTQVGGKYFFSPPRNLINFWSFDLILFLKLFYFVWSFWSCAHIWKNPPQQRPKSAVKLNLSKIACHFSSNWAFQYKIYWNPAIRDGFQWLNRFQRGKRLLRWFSVMMFCSFTVEIQGNSVNLKIISDYVNTGRINFKGDVRRLL